MAITLMLTFEVKSINATGIFTDFVRKMDDQHGKPIMCFSQGMHLVVDQQSFDPKADFQP